MIYPRHHIHCPMPDCEYWAAFGGYLAPLLSALYAHVQKDHPELRGYDTRRKGGVIDAMVGEALMSQEERGNEPTD